MFHFDFNEHPEMSFEVFLVKFEQMLIEKIVNEKEKLFAEQDCLAETMKVLFKFYDKSLFE